MGNLNDHLKYMRTDSFRQECATENKKSLFSQNDICPFCNNTGWEHYIKDGKDYVRECRCGLVSKAIHSGRLKFAELPESFKDAKLDNFKKNVYKEQKSKDMIVEAAKAIKYWLQNFNNMKKRGIGLYIYSGTKGSGKTRLAVSLANEIIYKYKAEVKFATSLQILNAIKSTWAVKGDSENQLLNDFSTIDILILDDFGIEQAKEWINDRFYEIINGRYIRKKITIFTSNMRLDDLDYDDRITNRIKERVFQIPFPEESVRDTLSNQLREELINGMTGNQ